MKGEDWLDEIARTAREMEEENHAQLDERWDRLSAGNLSETERSRLRALAEESEEGRWAYEAFRPLGGEFHARVARRLRQELGDPDTSSVTASTEPNAQPPPAGRILPFRRGGGRIRDWVAAAASLAAVLVFFVVRGSVDATRPLPEYRAELSGDREIRSGSGAPREWVLSPGSRFDLLLRPATAVSGDVEVRFFLERDGELRRWQPPFDAHPNGSVEVVGTIGDQIELEPGRWTLWALVGRPGKLPEMTADLRAGLENERPRTTRYWRILRADLRITNNPG